jgi:hypothetical protein
VKSFLAFLRGSREFWLLIFTLILGLTVAGWASIRILSISFIGLVVSLGQAFLVGVIFILYSCYENYRGAKTRNVTAHSIEARIVSVKRELISAVPLFLAGVADIYFILTERFDSILVVTLIAFPSWLCLRFLLIARKNKKDK